MNTYSLSSLKNRYRDFFSISEIETSDVLQLALGALLLSLTVTFFFWAALFEPSAEAVVKNANVCWPYFKNCGFLNVLWPAPYGYSQNAFYALLFAVCMYAVYAMWRKDWVSVHAALLVCLLWKIFVVFILSMNIGGNFDYYDIVFLAVVLFIPRKLFFLRLSYVVLYFLAATIKFDDGWILGTYFTTLLPGLAIFGNALAPLITNAVILLETVGTWFLLSSRKMWQRAALCAFVLFHLYSALYVGLRYPLSTIPMLLILFGPLNYAILPEFNRSSRAGWFLIGLLFALQSIAFLIPGDHKLTLEGNHYGLYMFEANHQCVSSATFFFKDGPSKDLREESKSARDRCDPYSVFFRLHEACRRFPIDIARIPWTFDHSVNGGPFYRIVDVTNACALSYTPFSHNAWIKTYEENPIIVGYPVKDLYY